jgi:hypothetical protein
MTTISSIIFRRLIEEQTRNAMLAGKVQLTPQEQAGYDLFRGKAHQVAGAGHGLRDRSISPGSPWQNPYVERLMGTVCRECLDRVLVFGEARMRL